MQDRNIATTLLKGVEVLRAFRGTDGDVTQADLARRTGLDRATVRRLSLTLVQAGLLAATDRGYRLAPGVLTLAGAFLRANAVGHSVQPVLNDCATRMGGEVSLAVRDGMQAIYVAQSATAEARVSFGFTIGSTLPLLPTAVGRMLLAGLPEGQRADLIAAAPLEAMTADTCLDRDAIAKAVEAAIYGGVSVVRGEYESGIAGLAVPVGATGPERRARAVLGTSLPLALPDLIDRQAKATVAMQMAAARLAELPALGQW
ncbi:IclR family transcriptional regulator [Chachezhania sediminis]|uniref:IclR family transcriptional regulator n=1 Tax=Chachezhania sediminis TaxID=2599291 RepID=UPI00131D0F1E|nr:helix-turn-helix domain-containing protein [Chachezhania sediminis]